MIGRYLINVLISLDQLGNSLLGGDPDETISSRIGRIEQKWGGKIPRWRIFTRLTAWALDKIDPGHCADSIEHDEGDDAIWDRRDEP